MPSEAEMLKHLVEARNLLNPDVRDKIKRESYMGGRSHLDILKYGLDLAEKMYKPYLAIRPIEAEREFSTLIKDLEKEIKKLMPTPPKVKKQKEPEKTPEPVVVKTNFAPCNLQAKTGRKYLLKYPILTLVHIHEAEQVSYRHLQVCGEWY